MNLQSQSGRASSDSKANGETRETWPDNSNTFYMYRDSAEDYSQPLVHIRTATNQPCWNGEDTLMLKKTYDKVYDQVDDCSSEYKGKEYNSKYEKTGYEINEYDFYEENGILDDILDLRRPSSDKYKSSYHKNYDRYMYQRGYPEFKMSCMPTYTPANFKALSKEMGVIKGSFLAVMVFQIIVCVM